KSGPTAQPATAAHSASTGGSPGSGLETIENNFIANPCLSPRGAQCCELVGDGVGHRWGERHACDRNTVLRAVGLAWVKLDGRHFIPDAAGDRDSCKYLRMLAGVRPRLAKKQPALVAAVRAGDRGAIHRDTHRFVHRFWGQPERCHSQLEIMPGMPLLKMSAKRRAAAAIVMTISCLLIFFTKTSQ